MLDDRLSCVLVDEIGYMMHVMAWLSWMDELLNFLMFCFWIAGPLGTVLSIIIFQELQMG